MASQIVTDQRPDDAMQAALRERGIELVVAPPE